MAQPHSKNVKCKCSAIKKSQYSCVKDTLSVQLNLLYLEHSLKNNTLLYRTCFVNFWVEVLEP